MKLEIGCAEPCASGFDALFCHTRFSPYSRHMPRNYSPNTLVVCASTAVRVQQFQAILPCRAQLAAARGLGYLNKGAQEQAMVSINASFVRLEATEGITTIDFCLQNSLAIESSSLD